MTTGALVLVLLLVLGVVVAAVAFGGRPFESTRTEADGNDDWLLSARAVVRQGDAIKLRLSEKSGRSPRDLSDESLDEILSDLRSFGENIAVVSATARTAMDTRVCREVGLRARSLATVYERELRLSEMYGAEPRSALEGDARHDPARRLDEFAIALSDLESHVELL